MIIYVEVSKIFLEKKKGASRFTLGSLSLNFFNIIPWLQKIASNLYWSN